MNTESISEPTSTPVLQTLDFSSESSQPKRLHRKIAKLPKKLRDLINTMLDDNIPAKDIIIKLNQSSEPLPYPINEMDISRWKSTGYQRYLAHLDHLDSIEASREAALEMVANNNLSLPQATLQVIAAQCFEILADFSAAAVKQKLAEDPLKYTSFLHVFARLTREMVHLEKFQDARAAAQAQKSDPNRDPEAEATAFWTRHTNQMFNRKDPSRIKSENPQGIPPQRQPVPSNNPEGIASDAHDLTVGAEPPSPIENQNGRTSLVSKFENLEEHCLDCHHPLPPLTPEGKRPFERCQVCNILLPPPGTCTRPSADKCHHCGTTLPRRLPSGRRPKYVCHNCACGLGRETDEDIKKYAQE